MTPSPKPLIVEYDSDWPERFRALAESLGEHLGPTAVRIEHIGGTSIPGMAAKAVLDVQVSVADLDVARLVFARPLADLGFEQSAHRFDHVPAGRTEDPQLGRSFSGYVTDSMVLTR